MELHEKRRVSYVVTALALFGGAYLLRNDDWQGSATLHTLMELAATLLAAFVGTMALIRFFSRKDAQFLYIGAGFLGTALLDGYHTVVTSVYFQPYMPSDNPHLVPWSWIASRLFLSIMLFVSWLLWFRHRNDPGFKPNTRIVLSAMVVATLAAFLFFATVPLPSIATAGSFIGRPVELLPGVFFLMALAGYLYKGSWRDDQFEHWLVLSLIVGVATQTVFMPFSDQLYDLEFNLAHLLKKLSYILVLIGLLASLYRTYKELQSEEEELHRASVYARSLIEASLDPLVTISAEGIITDVNQATEQATGRNRAELIGTDFSDYFTEPEKAKAGYRQVFAENFVTDYPLALRHRDGHVIDVLYNASVYRNEAGEVLGVFAAARDITERKKAELEVAQLNLQNKLILDSAGEGIYGLDVEGRCTFVNPAALQMLGFTADELLGRYSHAVFHHSRQDGSPYPESECPVQAACRQGMVHRGRDFYWHRDRISFPVEFISTPILVSGKITGAVVAFRDITERIQAETALFEAQQVFRTLVENSPDVIVRYDREGRRLYVNPEFERINHLSASEVIGKKPVEVSTELAPVADVFTEKLMAVMASGAPDRIDLSWSKEGRSICWFVRVVPEFDADGNVVSALTIWSDITERKQAEVVLRQSEEALKEAQRIAHLGSWHLDFATNQVVWSEELYNMYGFDPTLPPPLYTESMKLFTPESWEKLSAAIARVSEDGSPYELELEAVQQNGGHGWMLARGELMKDASGATVGVRGVVMDITERKLAEKQLRRSEQGLSEAQRIAHLGNWELDLSSNALRWSDEIYRIFEIDPQQFGASYDAFLNAIHPDDRERVSNAYIESVKNRTPYEIEHRLLMQDGRIKYVNEKCETHYAEDGRPLRSVGTVHDITERKLDEEALQRLNRELRAISNCNQALMRAEDEQALLDDICQIICDDAGYRMAWVGYAENDEARTIRPASWAGIENGYLEQAQLSWADTERGQGPCGLAIRSGQSVSIQDFTVDPKALPWRAAALQRGYRSSISLPLMGEDARTFGILNIYSSMPNSFTSDERRLLEELAGDMAFGIVVLRARIERNRAEENLLQMNERYTLATRAARLGVWDWNLQKNELVWDERMYELYGVNKQDFPGAYQTWLNGIHPDDRAFSDEISMQAQRGEREYDTEFRVVWPDGSVHYLKAYGQFVRDADGRPLRMTGVNYDITELKAAENKIIELNRDLERRVEERTVQLEAANKELESFSYSVSHDLRSPLRAIDGFSRILLEDYNDKLDDEGKRLLNVVRDNTSRMAQLIDDILKFSRAGRLEINFSRIDMEKLAHTVFDELMPKDTRLQLEVDAIPPAMGDAAMMHQVFVNLLSNAIKFSSAKAHPVIKVGCTIEADQAVYYVRDNGAGFDMQYSDKLFGVFQRLHGVSEFEGTGIGLAIVKRIITRHGGRVWAEGKVGEGATVYFALPVTAE